MDTNPAALCPGCFQSKGRANPCPHCGFDETAPRPVQALPLGTLLHDQFVVGRVLGKPGGFGITYLAWDRLLEAIVAIKEYLPRELVVRAQDSRTLHPHSSDETDLFRYGLEQFLAEARTLAKLDHPNLVRVRQFFEANGTAYLVMDYYQGCSLAEHLDRLADSRMNESDALALMQPILDGLRAVHAKGFLHRDIKPQNIYLAATDSGGVRPILLDFGAARQAVGERSLTLSVVLTDGYAPLEQYHSKGRQGPWSDLHAVAAVLYQMLVGERPPAATERVLDAQGLPKLDCSENLQMAITAALSLVASARPQNVEKFQAMLSGSSIDSEACQDRPPETPGSIGKVSPSDDAQKHRRPARLAIGITILIGTLALLAGGLIVLKQNVTENRAEMVDSSSEIHVSTNNSDNDSINEQPIEGAADSPSELAPEVALVPNSEPNAEALRLQQEQAARLAAKEKWLAEREQEIQAEKARLREERVEQSHRAKDTVMEPPEPPLVTPVVAESTRKPERITLYPSEYAGLRQPNWCHAATTSIERAICADSELARADAVMGAVYADLRTRLSSAAFARIKEDQRTWMKQRNTTCSTANRGCLKTITERRLAQLLAESRAFFGQ